MIKSKKVLSGIKLNKNLINSECYLKKSKNEKISKSIVIH
jgi:hypothetical protein